MEIPTTKPYFTDEEIQLITHEIQTVLKSGRLILGPYTRNFEKEFSEYIGVKHAIAVSSCTSALEITLRYFNVTEKEVIVPTNTFLASANAVIYSGGNPVLADINPETLNLDINDTLKRITQRTAGIIIVHIAGMISPEIETIREICQDKGIFLIEDVAHAHGATINNQKAGSLGDAGCFSFYPTKVMTTCTGGMITTNDDGLADYSISLRHHGVGKDLNNIVNLGNDWLMSEIDAVIGTYQLKSLEANLKRRNEIAEQYKNGLITIDDVTILTLPSHMRHSYYKYPIRLSPVIDREKLMKLMKENHKISLGTSYDPPCHLQPAYQKLFGFHAGMFPVAEKTLSEILALPMFVQMKDEEVKYVLLCLKETLPKCRLG